VPTSGRGRSVPLARPFANALAPLLKRERFTSEDDYLFVGLDGQYLDGSALRRPTATRRRRRSCRRPLWRLLPGPPAARVD